MAFLADSFSISPLSVVFALSCGLLPPLPITFAHLISINSSISRCALRGFAEPLLAWAVHLYHIRPRVIRLDAAYWGGRLIAWIHVVLGAVAVIPWNPRRQQNRSCLPPTWTKEELGKRSSIERFFGRVFLFFRLQRPPLCGWSEIASQVALTYTASIIVGLAAQQAGRPDLIRSPKRVLAHLWERDSEL